MLPDLVEYEDGVMRKIDNLACKGCAMPGAAGYTFPDFTTSFTILWKGEF